MHYLPVAVGVVHRRLSLITVKRSVSGGSLGGELSIGSGAEHSVAPHILEEVGVLLSKVDTVGDEIGADEGGLAAHVLQCGGKSLGFL